MRSPALSRQILQDQMRSKLSAVTDVPASDKRRWLSFLTWAFVLAEMAGRDAFLPTAAHAGDGETGHAGHHASDAAPFANNLPNIDVSTAAESPEPITYQHAAPMPVYATEALPSELAAAKEIPAAGLGPEPYMASYGGGGGGSGEAASASGAAELHADPLAHTLEPVPDQPLSLATGKEGSLVELGLHVDLGGTVHDILGGVTSTLGSLPLLGETLGDVGNVLATTTSNLLSALAPVVSLVGLGDSGSHQFGSALGLPGQLQFAATSDASGPSELLSLHGNYTSYGIALSIGVHDGVAAGDTASHADAPDLVALDVHIGDDLHGAGIHVGSDALHLDQTILKTAADVLA